MTELLLETARRQRSDAARRARGRSTRGTASAACARDLRRQIASLERELAELFATAFPRRGIELRGRAPPAARGSSASPSSSGSATRSPSACARPSDELGRRTYVEERNRETLERMIAEPGRFRWLRISNEDVGERGCKHWHARPRWGPIGHVHELVAGQALLRLPLSRGRGLAGPAPNEPPDLMSKKSRKRRRKPRPKPRPPRRRRPRRADPAPAKAAAKPARRRSAAARWTPRARRRPRGDRSRSSRSRSSSGS